MSNNVIEMKPSRVGMSKLGARMVLTPKGTVTDQNCASLENMFNECVEQRKTEVILDCKAISFMDSAALELVHKMHDDLKMRGGILKVINLNPVCRDIFLATRLINTLHVYDDIHEAIRSHL